MNAKGGFYQPIDIYGQLFWIWWAILTMLGVIVWSEMSYDIRLWPLLYLALMTATLIIGIWRRRVYLRGQTLFIGRMLRFDYEELDLANHQNWELHGHRLVVVKGQRHRKYWLSRRFVKQLKEQV